MNIKVLTCLCHWKRASFSAYSGPVAMQMPQRSAVKPAASWSCSNGALAMAAVAMAAAAVPLVLHIAQWPLAAPEVLCSSLSGSRCS